VNSKEFFEMFNNFPFCMTMTEMKTCWDELNRMSIQLTVESFIN
jgi:hypothetical protein